MEDNKKPEPETLDGSSSVTDVQPASTNPSTPPKPELTGFNHRGKYLKRFLKSGNIYLIIFVLIVLLSATGVLVMSQSSEKKPTKRSAQSLTDQQLAELKGATTVIGDSQQILDIQSNAVFENQVLLRGNLDVAGTVKVGGPLNLASVTVGGTSNFGNLQVNGTLSVAGNTTLQGTVTFQRGISASTGSFSGLLSAGQINTSNLQLSGDLIVNRHIAGGGGTPSRTNGSALGGGGTASVSGSDTAGTVTINTGSSPPAGCFVTVHFAVAFGSTPHVVISPSNSSSAGLNYYTNRAGSNFSVCTTNAPSASTTYLFDYHVFD